MSFIYQDLGQRLAGDRLETTLSTIANVRLMDAPNFEAYKNGAEHKYFGGLVKTSPSILTIPNEGQWFVVVDMKDLPGTTRASFRVLPYVPPVVSAADRGHPKSPALSETPSLIRQFPPTLELNGENIYDVFLTYTVEDKDTIAKALTLTLEKQGLTIWHNEFDKRLGSNLRNKINFGISRSRFGIIIFTKTFFARDWKGQELESLIATRPETGAPQEEDNNKQILLPLWHGITKQDVINFSPKLAEKVARSTAIHTVDEIAKEIKGLVAGA